VISDISGNLYGTTYIGALSSFGAVFELMFPGPTECTLNNFRNGNDGSYPFAGLIFDKQGTNLYGATSNGGKNGGGTVFELTPLDTCSWTLKTLYSFTGTNGESCGPWGTLAMNGTSNIYGTTYCDGANGYGNVFELSPTGGGNWSYTSLYDFTGSNDGANPISTAVMDTNGNLYGTASAGGTQNVGVVWEITFP
jgi:uncharacterized repeat protein (TIGR03803 family)